MVSALACSNSPLASLPPLLAVGFVSGLVSVALPSHRRSLAVARGGPRRRRHRPRLVPVRMVPLLGGEEGRRGEVLGRPRGDSVLPPGGGGKSGNSANNNTAAAAARSPSREPRAATQQRIGLAVEPVAGRHLLSGGEDGWVRAFDLRGEWEAAQQQHQQQQRE